MWVNRMKLWLNRVKLREAGGSCRSGGQWVKVAGWGRPGEVRETVHVSMEGDGIWGKKAGAG